MTHTVGRLWSRTVGTLLVVLIVSNAEAQPVQDIQSQSSTPQSTAFPQGPPAPPPGTAAVPLEDPMGSIDKRVSILEEWKTKIEKLPMLSNKVNFGLNALQILYTHQDAKVAEGKSQDNISVRRSELLAYGKINEHLPRWHVLYEFQSINFTAATPGCNPGTDCSNRTANPTGGPAAATFFRESYIDYRPVIAWAPYLNFIRMGIFRMPWGIYTETSGGLRDVISSP